MKFSIAILGTCLFFISCSNSNQNKDISKIIEEVQLEDTSISVGSPCELVSTDDIAAICNVAAEFQIDQKDKQYTYPTCVFKWKDGALNTIRKVGSNDITVERENELMIVMVGIASEAMFKQSTSIYKESRTIDGIGEMAIWDNKMQQLSFIGKGQMFHVNVKAVIEKDANLEIAKKIAELLISKI